MRILASNPDTLGDFVLRQPLYRTLLDAGHELTLVVRAGVLPLAPYVAPGAKTIVLGGEPYAHDVEQHWEWFAAAFDAARAARPDVLLVAPYRWTLFDEKLAEELPAAVRKVGMSGLVYAGDPHAGAAPASRMRFDAVATVAADQLEIEKNAALCEAVLGRGPSSVDPTLSATGDDVAGGRRVVERLGLEPGGYWVACVGGTEHVAIKTWHADAWGRVLGEWAKRYGRRFLFVGLPEEQPAARDVLRAMAGVLGSDEAAARHAAVWMEPGGTLAELLAVTQLSAGYVGHDTGPMHVAAAMGKPVLAVFGGGTWPRFRPAVGPSVALLVGVPCVGCGWVCTFEQPHCIKAVPEEHVLRAAADIEEGRVAGREARVAEPGEALQRRMIREAAALARTQVREKAELGKQLRASHAQREADVSSLHEARQREAAEAERLRAELTRVHDAARAAAEAHAAHAGEMERLRRELEARSVDTVQATVALRDRTAEVERLREQVRAVIPLLDRAGTNGDEAPASGAGAGGDVGASAGEEVARLRSAVERLEARVRHVRAPAPPPARRPVRQVLTDLVVGSRHYRRRPAPHLPKVTVVVPLCGAADAADVGATIESCVAQAGHGLELVVVVAAADSATVQATLDLLREHERRIDRLLADAGANVADAAARGLGAATGDVLHVLHPGDVLGAGAVLRVAEYFAGRPGVLATYSEDAVAAGGWTFAAPPQPTADVTFLRRRVGPGAGRCRNGVFVRRRAYQALGPLKPEFGRAAEWELWLRLARRFELCRMPGHFRTVRGDRPGDDDALYRADVRRAAEAFDKTFGPAGRVRVAVIGAAHRAFDAMRRFRPGRATGDGPLFFPTDRQPAGPSLPRARPPSPAPGQPASPLTGRLPDRFLFSTPDVTGGDRSDGLATPRPLHHVYYDSSAGAALAYPPLDLGRLSDSYAARHADGSTAAVVPPPPGVASPYARYRGGLLGRLGAADLLARLPSPYWWFRAPDFSDPTAAEILRLLRGLLDAADESVRFLNVGCFDGTVLDRVRSETRWQTGGTETNASAAAAARSKGHSVWEAAPQDAPLALPVGESFDAIFLAHTVEHLPDPPLVLRRLRQLLKPRGLLVLDQPNLDSAHARLFGPTWGHWQVPYHRTLTGRRGVRLLARLCDLRVLRLVTRTHPYPTCVSIQLNDLGLAGIVPDTARFPNAVASRGVRLTGWSRLLWDWRGKGDYLYAVLQAL